ncbi:MAG TPA: thermonuclease family protein [Bacteroidales bacterium]|nr:thermonuclease family protein [Bacteroidales bacterium]
MINSTRSKISFFINNYFLLLLFFFFSFSCNNTDPKEKNKEDYYTVEKVVDGDTFWVDNGTQTGLKIRMIGIDAPESRKSEHKEIGYYGKEAKNYLKNLLKDKKVKLEFDVEKLDQYKRTLAYVYLEDGTFVNADLIKNGYAMVMTFPPNVKYVDEFVKLQKEARNNKRGLWGKDNY